MIFSYKTYKTLTYNSINIQIVQYEYVTITEGVGKLPTP